MHGTVLWFEDRFGIKNNYLSAWLYAIKQAGLDPLHTKRINLHARLRGQLLTKYKNRKAPTWIPDRQQDIKDAMMTAVAEAGGASRVSAIVLGAPESLACLDMDPESGTLARLRGSVYEFMGIPAIVTLPMSAWFTKVDQRDIEMANYGVESEEDMASYASAKDITLIEGEDGDEESDEDDSAKEEEDLFFYIPVMTPVGKVMIQFDMAKTARIANGNAFNFWMPK